MQPVLNVLIKPSEYVCVVESLFVDLFDGSYHKPDLHCHVDAVDACTMRVQLGIGQGSRGQGDGEMPLSQPASVEQQPGICERFGN